MSLFHRLLRRLMAVTQRMVCRWPVPIVVISLILAGLGTWKMVSGFDVQSDSSDLLSNESTEKKDFNELKDNFSSDSRFIVLIQSPDVQQNRLAADAVGTYLETLAPHISTVLAKIDYAQVKPRLLFTLDMPKLNKIADKVEAEAKAASSTGNSQIALDLNSFLEKTKADFADPEYLREKNNWKAFTPFVTQFVSVLNKAREQAEGVSATPTTEKPQAASTDSTDDDDDEKLDPEEMLARKEYFSMQDGKSLLVMAYPGIQDDNADSPYSNTVAAIRAHLPEIEKQFPGCSIHLTGEPVLDADTIAAANTGTTHAAMITIVLILTLFGLSYRTVLRPALTFLSLIVAVLWSLGFALATVGHFNILSVAVIPMVLGIGIDFGIQILGRYEEELSKGLSVPNAIGQALENTGVAIITGGSTTATAFFTLCFNQFIGLSELGEIAGFSMIFCMIGSLVFLPAMFYLRDRSRSRAQLMANSSQKAWGFLKNWDKDLVRFPWICVGIAAILTILSIASIPSLTFDYNLLHLQSPTAESVQILRKVMDASKTENGNEISTIYASVVADDLSQARILSAKLSALPVVAKVDSLLPLLPDDGDVKLPVIQRIVKAAQSLNVSTNSNSSSSGLDLKKARKDVESLLDQAVEGQKEAHGMIHVSSQAKEADAAFSKMIPALKGLKQALSLPDATLQERFNPKAKGAFNQLSKSLQFLKTQVADRPIQMEDLPTALKQLFLGKDGKILLQVYGKKDLWDRGPDEEFVKALLPVVPHVTGTPVLNYLATNLLINSYLEAAGLAFLAIVILILLHFQSVKYLLLTILPLVLAVLWRSGLMVLLGISFNPANIVTLPLIIGIDVAFGIYMVDRFREDGGFRIFSSSTGKAIIMSALTSFFGFVSLLVADFRGIYSIGVLMSWGIAIGLVTSIFVLPQILVLLPKTPADKH